LVTQVEFTDAGTVESRSKDGTKMVWNVASVGKLAEGHTEFEAGKFAWSEGHSAEHKVGKYLITFKGDLLLISKGEQVQAFFRAPHAISVVQSNQELIGVGCENGEVLQLRAPWLVA